MKIAKKTQKLFTKSVRRISNWVKKHQQTETRVWNSQRHTLCSQQAIEFNCSITVILISYRKLSFANKPPPPNFLTMEGMEGRGTSEEIDHFVDIDETRSIQIFHLIPLNIFFTPIYFHVKHCSNSEEIN